MKIWPGKPYPLGATWDGAGVNFSLFSENATKVELCLFDGTAGTAGNAHPDDTSRRIRFGMSICPKRGRGSFMVIGFTGRTSPQKVIASIRPSCFSILTPRRSPARSSGAMRCSAIRIGHPDQDLSRDEKDSAAGMPKCVVIDPAFSWGNDAPPATPWHKTIIYELHVKGFTMRHPGVPQRLARHLCGARLVRR